jgi:hypothetical protein
MFPLFRKTVSWLTQKDEYNQLEWDPKDQRFAQNSTLFMACSGGTHGQIMGYERGKRSRGLEI